MRAWLASACGKRSCGRVMGWRTGDDAVAKAHAKQHERGDDEAWGACRHAAATAMTPRATDDSNKDDATHY